MVSSTPGEKRWFFRERVCQVPTWRTLLLVTVCVIILGLQFSLSIHPFLALSEPVRGEILVAEGWLPDGAMAEALAVFRRGGYTLLITTGEPLTRGSVLSEYGTYAELGAAVLIRMGASADSVIAVPAAPSRRNRTYASAVALRRWVDSSDLHPSGIDVFSLGPHTRRSRDLFQRALGNVPVGSYAAIDDSYDAERWWSTSRGFQAVVEETVGYLYSLLLPPGEE